MITFSSPEYFLLFPLAGIAAWYGKRFRLNSPLRIICVLLLAFILVGPSIERHQAALDLWVLVDRSASVAEILSPRLREWEALLEHGKHQDDRIFYLDFADQAQLRHEGDAHRFQIPPEETRTALAIRYAATRMSPDRSHRLLLLSDGFSTEPVTDLTPLLIEQRVPLDYRFVGEDGATDFRIDGLRTPLQVKLREPFLLELRLHGTRDESVAYELYREQNLMHKGMASIVNGQAILRFTDRAEQSGGYRYRAVILPKQDAHPGNNSAQTWVQASGDQAVLLVTSFEQDPLHKVLSNLGGAVQVMTNHQSSGLHVGHLTGKRAVILNNVGAYELSHEFLEGLRFFVEAQGGGLIMFGGRKSFGAGGYFGSPLDPILPVSMELREEHRKQAVSMALVLDRSGSMAVGVSGNMGNMTKMDLANEGAARTVSLLGPGDMITILAVDSEAHTVVPLTNALENATSIASSARSITSGGGGIFVYNGLKAAWDILKSAPTKQKHIILFADANDAEQPDDYQNLLLEIAKAGGTVSVIGLGSVDDADALFLKDVSIGGRGRLFFVSNAMDLPAAFAQETVSVARSTFIEDPTKTTATPAWGEMSVTSIPRPSEVDGYNLNYVKKEASTALLSDDDYDAPLVAFFQRGLGRIAALSFPVVGDFSSRVRSWAGYGDFLQTLVRWIRGSEIPAGIQLKTEVHGNTLQANFYYDQTWEKQIALSPPRLVLSTLGSEDLREPLWERVKPGHFQTSLVLNSGEVVRGAVQLGSQTLPFGPIGIGKNAEWAFDRRRLIELQELARTSGGEERVDLERIWDAPRRADIYSLRIPLLIALLCLFILEALLNRLNFQFSIAKLALPKFHIRNIPFSFPSFSVPHWKRNRKLKDQALPQNYTPEESKEQSGTEPTQVDKSRSRFEKAKRRGIT